MDMKAKLGRMKRYPVSASRPFLFRNMLQPPVCRKPFAKPTYGHIPIGWLSTT